MSETTSKSTPVHLIAEGALEGWLAAAPGHVQAWAAANGFKGGAGKHLVVPDAAGNIDCVLVGLSDPVSLWDAGALAKSLPPGPYALAGNLDVQTAEAVALGWQLGSYEFDRYKSPASPTADLQLPESIDPVQVSALADATMLVRDLVNTPANDMGPGALADAAKDLAGKFGADFTVTVGDDLLKENYPAIHAVGRAADDAPRLIEMTWGDPAHPTVALVGKGVCFDSGGLDIKPASGMKLMKKDMGGSAHVLGIAHCVMALGLKVHLKVLVPAVENAISGNAMRPLDVVRTRAGITIEIGNTDAEGRVILADALTRAAESDPELVIDFATLTGAARVALGTELPALFCNDDGFASDILAAGTKVSDPLWRMPLWPGYRKMIEGKVADITNSPDGGYAGAITAALFLERFAPENAGWAHIDVMAWNVSSKPGRPEGGEAMGMRAFTEMLTQKYGRA
ncbi:MAG: leucyl aminopeptidase family protein [Rhodospirillales bacterium]|nr:leucyl aminopeptidase family protein [Rhodospirillales bacterium]MBO6787850.1 leucyl aminopeptidase family protein [Rhodospirillales bacterium]